MRQVAEGSPFNEPVRQGINPSFCDIGISPQVPIAIEERIGVATLCCAKLQVMLQSVVVGVCNFGISSQVPISVEQRIWVSTLRDTKLQVVEQRVVVGVRNIWISP